MPRRFTQLVLCLVPAAMVGCGEPADRAADEPGRRVGETLVGLVTEGEIDRIASDTATALRSSALAGSATQPLRSAPPDWRNTTDVPVDQPAAFVDQFTGLVNDRCGANVQFLRRPWVRADAPREELLKSADLTSRLTLMPDRKGSSRKLRLRTEMLKPGDEVAFSHECVFEVDPALLAKARRDDRRREVRLEEARAERRVQASSDGEVRFTRDSLAERLRLSRLETKRLPDGRLEVKWRIVTRTSRQKTALQVVFYDRENHQVEVSRPLLRELRAGRSMTITLVSQLPADRYILLVDRY